jgi:hypothetical protein
MIAGRQRQDNGQQNSGAQERDARVPQRFATSAVIVEFAIGSAWWRSAP